MKIKRQKQAKHILSLYKNTFSFREPYEVLVDGTFAQAAHKNKVFINDQLSRYLGAPVQCFTTKCVMAELALLGSQMQGGKAIAQTFPKKFCAHHKAPVPAYECLKSMIGDTNESKYFVATQDSNLTKYARSIPGIPLLYIYQMSILLDKPSKTTNGFIKDLSQGKLEMPKEQIAVLTAMKKEANLVTQPKRRIGKRKRPKGPNPLSCKKKKKLK